MAMNAAQHKIVNLLKTWDFFVWLCVPMYLMCGPSQLFFQCSPETPKCCISRPRRIISFLEMSYRHRKKKILFLILWHHNLTNKCKRALADVAQWLSGLSAGLQTRGSLVWFPVRAHSWVVGPVPSGGRARGNHTLMFPSFSPSLLAL